MTGRRSTRCVTFTSAARGLGRTAAVANTAMILAGARERVLVVDWSGERPTDRGYFKPFSVGEPPEVAALGALLDRLTGQDPGTWRPERFQPPGDAGPIDLVTPLGTGRGESLPGLPWAEPIDVIVQRLRDAMEDLPYGYILVDAPTEPNADIIDVIARGSDVAVVAFGPGRLAALQAANLAEAIQAQAAAGIDLVPLQAGPRTTGPEIAQVDADLLTQLFESPPGTGKEVLTVPFLSRQAGRSILATLAEEPDSEVVRAYGRLTERLSGGVVTGHAELPAALRANYRIAVGLDEARETERFTVVHDRADRRWADWVQAQLRGLGADVTLAAEGEPVTGRVVVIASAHLLPALADARHGTDPALVLCVSDDVAERLPDTPLTLNLAGREQREAIRLLQGRLGLVAGGLPSPPVGFVPAYPLDPPPDGAVANHVLPDDGPFVGRDGDLAALRDRLMRDVDGCEPHVLGGPPGIGKTAMVEHYIRAFGEDYGIIWWVSARTPELARLDLNALAARLQVAPEGDPAAAVVTALRSSGQDNWLLVYDDADDLAALEDLIPSGGPGHVLITSRTAGDVADRLGPVDTGPGRRFLRERIDGLSDEHAETVVGIVEGLPLALRLAAAWIREAVDYLLAIRALDTDGATAWAVAEFKARVAQRMRTPGTDPTAACLDVTFESMEDGPLGCLAARLLELCAWLAPEGASHRLLASAPFLDRLAVAAGPEAGELVAADSMVLDQLLRLCVRFGLADVQWSRDPRILLHRRVQELIRDRLSPGQAAERQGQTIGALADIVPVEADGPVSLHGEVFSELHRHLGPSGAAESLDAHARRWLVEQVRFQYVTGDRGSWSLMLPMVEELLPAWPDDLLKGRLLVQVANLRRDLGRFDDALRASEQALTILRGADAAGRYWALTAGRGRTGDRRGLGQFGQALGEIEGVYEETRLLLGDGHRDTTIARNNLAEAAFLTGQHQLAEDTAVRAWRQQVAEFGETDPIALRIARRVGDYKFANGRKDEARRLLVTSLGQARDQKTPDRLSEMDLLRSLAIVDRQRGVDAADEKIRRAVRGFRAVLGAGHPSTLAAELSLAIELDEAGDHLGASRLGRRLLDDLVGVYGPGHPFVQLCRLDLGLFESTMEAPENTLATVREARQRLVAALGEQHPWAMVAALHEARALTGLGRADEALRLHEATAADLLDYLGDEHPYTEVAAAALETAEGLTEASITSAIYVDIPII
ncbi:FxSxx-COOH system tetratricopeptide repeat protein [Actinoallomurus iriomotensis]|uniref:NTPase n=1 Tax=Actinoallomurus iriomotensis TaxID=478107 RepID=A0A9W6S1V9_9ACTN|nr:FxSxx-COOH system tetratricopeptide repeat protein [Actinoallomurus iriomotensis]GLY85894.1 NTPase [Actinoallomurus iriomotensis]